MKRTDIEWTANVLPDGTTTPGLSANPLKYRDAAGKVVWACVKKSSGCAHCYAETIAHHYDRGGPFTRETMAGLTPFLDDKDLKHILTAKRIGGLPVAGSKCFIGDMTDVFGNWVSDELLDRLFAAIALRPDVTFQVLTKRADRMREYMTGHGLTRFAMIRAAMRGFGRPVPGAFEHPHPDRTPWPLPNLWLGVSVENLAAAEERHIPLLMTPAAVRFWSAEPLLGAIDMDEVCPPCRYCNHPGNVLTWPCPHCKGRRFEWPDWVIVGCESGRSRRPMADEWAASLVEQCRVAGVSCFVKQAEVAGRVTGEMDEFPQQLRVRNYPAERATR